MFRHWNIFTSDIIQELLPALQHKHTPNPTHPINFVPLISKFGTKMSELTGHANIQTDSLEATNHHWLRTIIPNWCFIMKLQQILHVFPLPSLNETIMSLKRQNETKKIMCDWETSYLSL